MGIVRDQLSNLAKTSASTTVVPTWSVNPQAGATVLVFVQSTQVAASISLSDNGTTPVTWTRDVSVIASTAGKGAFVFRGENITLPASGSFAVTVVSTGSSIVQAGGISYTGVQAGTPHATSTGSGTGTSVDTGLADAVKATWTLGDSVSWGAVIAGYVAADGSNEVWFGGFSDASSLSETITHTSPTLTEQFRDTDGVVFWPMAVADGIASLVTPPLMQAFNPIPFMGGH